MLHRIRESFAFAAGPPFDGPVEADETAIGGLRKNMPKHKRAALKGAGTGYAGKSIVAGVRDRATNRITAEVVPDTTTSTLTTFVENRTKPGCDGLYRRAPGLSRAAAPARSGAARRRRVGPGATRTPRGSSPSGPR